MFPWGGGGGGGERELLYKRDGNALVVLLRGVNLGYYEQNVNILSRKRLV